MLLSNTDDSIDQLNLRLKALEQEKSHKTNFLKLRKTQHLNSLKNRFSSRRLQIHQRLKNDIKTLRSHFRNILNQCKRENMEKQLREVQDSQNKGIDKFKDKATAQNLSLDYLNIENEFRTQTCTSSKISLPMEIVRHSCQANRYGFSPLIRKKFNYEPFNKIFENSLTLTQLEIVSDLIKIQQSIQFKKLGLKAKIFNKSKNADLVPIISDVFVKNQSLNYFGHIFSKNDIIKYCHFRVSQNPKISFTNEKNIFCKENQSEKETKQNIKFDWVKAKILHVFPAEIWILKENGNGNNGSKTSRLWIEHLIRRRTVIQHDSTSKHSLIESKSLENKMEDVEFNGLNKQISDTSIQKINNNESFCNDKDNCDYNIDQEVLNNMKRRRQIEESDEIELIE